MLSFMKWLLLFAAYALSGTALLQAYGVEKSVDAEQGVLYGRTTELK